MSLAPLKYQTLSSCLAMLTLQGWCAGFEAPTNNGLSAALEQLQFQRNLWFGLFILVLLVLIPVGIGYFKKRRLESSLSLTQRELSEKNEKLQASLAEKEALLKEIHHRVKNNMQLVSSIFLLQSREIKDPAALLAINQSQSRVKAMGLVHQKAYEAGNVTRVDFQEFLPEFIAQIKPLYLSSETITEKISAKDVHLDLDKAVPLGLIVHELVSNAYKHGFGTGEKGTLTVQLIKKDEKYNLLVKDTGCGLPDNFNYIKANSLGIRLVRLLTEQLEGKMSVSSGNGTKISVIFKAS